MAGHSATRQELLTAAVDYALAHGVSDLSLRQLAEQLGTSHRMLIHYFGRKERLLVEIVELLRAREREALTAFATDELPPHERCLRLWQHVSAPDRLPHQRLILELYGQALQGHSYASELLADVVDVWLAPLADLHRQRGVPALEARRRARLGIAVMHGLLLDLLATHDRAAVDAAMAEFLLLDDTALAATTGAA